MLDQKGEPHLMDFGLARLETETENLTHDGTILGTPAYMPPEQAAGDIEKISAASDQYSLGVTLYEMLCGERPFGGPPEIVIFNVISQEPPAPSSIRQDVPRDLETICLKAMSKNPQQRYPSCAELADDLHRWRADLPVSARRITLRERFQRWCKRNPMTSALILLAVVLLLTGTAVSTYFSFAADAARQLADNRATAALAAEKQTHEAKQQAQNRAEEVVEQKNRAETALNAAARSLYFARIVRVAGSIRSFDGQPKRVGYSNAPKSLDSCPLQFRHWEWGYVRNLLNGKSKLSFKLEQAANEPDPLQYRINHLSYAPNPDYA